jgi:hypothetical protein
MLNLTSFFQLELDAIGFYFVSYISWLSLPIVTGNSTETDHTEISSILLHSHLKSRIRS